MIVQFKFRNWRGLHAIERGDQVYFVSSFNEVPINKGDLCEVNVVGSICNSKRDSHWYEVFWVEIVKFLISEVDIAERYCQMTQLEQSFGAHCPRHIQRHELDFIQGLTSFEQFEEILTCIAKGQIRETSRKRVQELQRIHG